MYSLDYRYGLILLEVSLVKSLEASSVACLVLAHLMNCVVDCIEVLLLCESSDSLLVVACALLCEHSLFYVGLCVPYALAEKFCKLSCVLSLFQAYLLNASAISGYPSLSA